MLSCLKFGYEDHSKNGDKNKKNSFNNFHQRTYDYEELEKQLLNGGKNI